MEWVFKPGPYSLLTIFIPLIQIQNVKFLIPLALMRVLAPRLRMLAVVAHPLIDPRHIWGAQKSFKGWNPNIFVR